MTILTKYVLKEHVGPFTFALAALTSLMLLNFISRQFGELVGKGLPWAVIGEFFLLSIPFTVALTLPMSVLVAVLYAFSRLAAENEVTALKASGVSPWRLVAPAIGGGVVMSIGLLAFNDQVLPRANHRLKTLQDDISQAKPTFLLKEQVINPIAEGKFYLKAGKIDRTGSSGKMREVVIYDLADPTRRRTIYAESGAISLTPNRKDLDLDLYHGQMQEVATEKPGQLDRLFFDHDRIRIRDVAKDFKQSESPNAAKGDREMSVCEMERRLWRAEAGYRDARREYDDVVKGPSRVKDIPAVIAPMTRTPSPEPRGIGWAYCKVINGLFGVRAAQAAELPAPASRPRLASSWQDTVPRRDTVPVRDSTKKGEIVARHDTLVKGDGIVRRDSAHALPPAFRRLQRPSGAQAPLPLPATPTPTPIINTPAALPPATGSSRGSSAAARAAEVILNTPPPSEDGSLRMSRIAQAKLQLDLATRSRNRFAIEIHKKFSLAAACLIFVLLGAPIAVRFPRGGVGLVIGVSLAVFALYYVGLIGGESLANEGLVPPFWAMWGTNVMLTAVGIVLLFRMGREAGSGRGGEWGGRDRLDALRARFGGGPRARGSQS